MSKPHTWALLALWMAGLSGLALARPSAEKTFEKVIVLGIDGMDPNLLTEAIARYPDRMRHFARLVEDSGGMHALGTSIPPQSPVAWSNFITGRNPGGHGIFDFIHRDPVTRMPASSTTTVAPTNVVGLWGDWQFPLGGATNTNRTGTSFWKVLAEADVPADIWRMPANFPVEPAEGLSFPGMMAPALDSAYGEYTFYTTDPPAKTSVDGGKLVALDERIEGLIDTRLIGPENMFKEHGDAGAVHATVPMKIMLNRKVGACAIEIQDQVVILKPGDWSSFVTVSFEMLPMYLDYVAGGGPMSGIVRFYLRSIEPEVEIYASPINIDPRNPATPISLPESASADLADDLEGIGLYYTQGMAEEVNALKAGVLTQPEFMVQSDLVLDERVRMMDYAIDHYIEKGVGGLLFFYYSTVDLTNHMMWDLFDPQHPNHDPVLAAEDSSEWSHREGSIWKESVWDVYMRMDPILGHLRERLGEDITVIVMSDHGFAPYRRAFSLNTWLYEEGYLKLKEGHAKELPLDHPQHKDVFIFSPGVVDWENTVAYGMGFNGLYLNLKGREGCDAKGRPVEDAPPGIVEPGAQEDQLLAELKRKLEAIIDHDNGGKQLAPTADIAKQVYNGERMREAPDIQVGYNTDYQNSDESSVGRIPHAVFAPNMGGTFVGSHLMAHELVPGIVLTNRRILPGEHALEDLTVELLGRYGVQPAEGMEGHRVLE